MPLGLEAKGRCHPSFDCKEKVPADDALGFHQCQELTGFGEPAMLISRQLLEMGYPNSGTGGTTSMRKEDAGICLQGALDV